MTGKTSQIFNKVKCLDKLNMRQAILDFPKQFKSGAKAAEGICLKPGSILRDPENIIICGMGGSGMPGEIITTLRPIDVFPYKSYSLPPQAGNDSLIICVSYSGNTEETISSFQMAIDKKLPVITMTTGGKLEELSKKYDVPCVKLPKPYMPPRLAIGQMTAGLLKVLENHRLIDKKIVNEILKIGNSLKAKALEPKGKSLAKKIFKKIPIIYVSRKFMEIAWIWKNSLNETAKAIAFSNYFPELNHNEIVGFEDVNKDQISCKKIYVLILRDMEDSHPRILKQMEITKNIIEKEGVKVEFVNMAGKTMMEKIFSSTILGFWTSYHLALLYKVDPTEIKTIDEFKK
ncbi:MAG: bifunctional phosphoglucose/phosphomannose isomerase, partial [Patescibacteria group bacterium]